MARPKTKKDIFKAKAYKRNLIILFVVAFLLRFLFLSDFPFGMLPKEALLAVRGQFLFKSLTDEAARKLPFFFSSFDGYSLPFSSYLVSFFVGVFGKSLWSVRIGFALFGFLGLVAFYNILKKLAKTGEVPFWSTFVLTTSPWHIYLSRTPSDWFLLLNLFLLVFWFFLNRTRRMKLILGILFAIGLLVIFFSYLSLPLANQELFKNTFGFLQDKSILNGINRLRGEPSVLFPPLFAKFFYNKSFYILKLLENFTDHFKPQFYFSAGDANPLHGLTNFGPFLLVLLPVFIFGLFKAISDKSLKKVNLKLFLLFCLSILFSVLSYPSLNEEKLVFSFLIITIIIGYGFSKLTLRMRVLVIFFILLNMGFIVADILDKEELRVSRVRFLFAEKLISKTRLKNDNFDKVFVSDYLCPDLAPYFFYFKDNVSSVKTDLEKGRIKPHQWIGRIDNVIIGQKDVWETSSKEKIRFILSPDELRDISNYGFGQSQELLKTKVCYNREDTLYDKSEKPIYIVISGLDLDCKNE